MSSGIKLRSHGDHKFIESPSGNKITASKLEVGKTYLHHNQLFLRKIIRIMDKEVQYQDLPIQMYGACSKAHFAVTCPYEATDEEIEFILFGKK